MRVHFRDRYRTQSLFSPIVERLGYEYKKDEPVNITELRTLAISRAAAVGEPR